MLHPDTQIKWINETIGCGIMATRDIPKGTITWATDPLDRILSPDDVARLPSACRDTFMKYSYRNRQGDYIFCWDNTRFMNHSFRPNCITTAYHFELAVRDIRAGEELTNDYGSLNILEPFLACDEGSERKTVYPDDLTRHYQEWDRLLEPAFESAPTVEQPLRELLSNPQWQTLLHIASKQIPMESILTCLHPGSTSSRFTV